LYKSENYFKKNSLTVNHYHSTNKFRKRNWK